MNYYISILFRYTSLFLLFILLFCSMLQVWILHIIELTNGTQLPYIRTRAPPIPMLLVDHDGVSLPFECQRVGGRWYHPIRQLLPRRGAPTTPSSPVGCALRVGRYGGQPPRPLHPAGYTGASAHADGGDRLWEVYWWWYWHHPTEAEMWPKSAEMKRDSWPLCILYLFLRRRAQNQAHNRSSESRHLTMAAKNSQ